VAEEHRGDGERDWGSVFGGRNFWLSGCLILEEHVGVRKLGLSGYLWECKV